MEKAAQEAVKKIGQRLLSEANDLKRTFQSIASELDIDINRLERITQGEASFADTMSIAQLFAENYPVRLGDLVLDFSDHSSGIKIMRAEESESSGRIFDRADKDGNRTPYYEYRDTATVKMSPFKPEWIKELRVVYNSDPDNPDVAYNNGHFLHQMTAFIGPVNFYWEVDGEKFCKEMDTGSSNYITPFRKHSFTSRDPDQEAIIIAVTFAADAGKARNELYDLGTEAISSYILNNRDHKAGVAKLIKQLMMDRCLTQTHLTELAARRNINLDCNLLLSVNTDKPQSQLDALAEILNVPASLFELPEHTPDNEVVVKDRNPQEQYACNSDLSNPDYLIDALAGTKRMPFMQGFNFEICTSSIDDASELQSALHSYVYNYGDTILSIEWLHDGSLKEDILQPGDSCYLEPFVKHRFARQGESNANLFVFRVSGEVNLTVQKEISSFAGAERIIEFTTWFD